MLEKGQEDAWTDAMHLLITSPWWTWYKSSAYAGSNFKDYIKAMERYEGLIVVLPKELAVKCALLWCIKSLYHIPETREQANGYMDVICRGIVNLKENGNQED